MVCTEDSSQTSGASSYSDCIGTFAAIDPTSTTSEDINVLRFQSKDALTQADPSTRVIAWPDYRQSDYSADKLSWKVDGLLLSLILD